jgi:hypothetical protein
MYLWESEGTEHPQQFVCGFCGNAVASNKGWHVKSRRGHSGFQSFDSPQHIYICPKCQKPNYFDEDRQFPGVSPGHEVSNVPDDLAALYREARDCVSVNAFTASAMICRKLLMNVGVREGAEENKNFVYYVNFLLNEHLIPRSGHGWVDHIRQKGNEATHEIAVTSKADAEQLIGFTEMLLRCVYDFPASILSPVSAETSSVSGEASN